MANEPTALAQLAVDAAAKVLYEENEGFPEWDALAARHKVAWLRQAAAVLQAALPVLFDVEPTP